MEEQAVPEETGSLGRKAGRKEGRWSGGVAKQSKGAGGTGLQDVAPGCSGRAASDLGTPWAQAPGTQRGPQEHSLLSGSTSYLPQMGKVLAYPGRLRRERALCSSAGHP